VGIIVHVEFHNGGTSKLHSYHMYWNQYKSYSYSSATLGSDQWHSRSIDTRSLRDSLPPCSFLGSD
jgi:hypothetical protein